jgi:DMSO/TMAO reductase YedYZ molybdopterin-dependent catalytic subunit
MPGPRKSQPGVDAGLLIRDAARLLPDPSRRLFLRGGASVGALALLTGCNIADGASAERALRVVSEFNDWVQARLFNPRRLAQTYPEGAITRPFRFNAFYPEDPAPDIDEDRYRLIVDGLVENKQPWTLEQLNALPQETQITRLICVEGWSAIGKWTGVPLREFLKRIGADLSARYVHFTCSGAIRAPSTCRRRCIRRRR